MTIHGVFIHHRNVCYAVGGSGWGPVVTSTLLARGGDPRLSIGSVSLVTSFVLISHIDIANIQWQMVVGFIIGGMIAAPLAAHLCGRLPSRVLIIMISLMIMLLSVSMLMNGS